jgi:hypothetical protein
MREAGIYAHVPSDAPRQARHWAIMVASASCSSARMAGYVSRWFLEDNVAMQSSSGTSSQWAGRISMIDRRGEQ